jgi:hypothetical protein
VEASADDTGGGRMNIYIGYDSIEPVAYHTLAHSILRRSSIPVSFTPLVMRSLRGAGGYARERGPLESTEFSLTRFLVPSLSNYEGWSVFMDCDMLCRVNIADLMLEVLPQQDKAVIVCQHDYTPSSTTKFLNRPQTVYARKQWSSFMVFNNAKCKALTPQYVNTATGLQLHQFQWVKDTAIGSLPLLWNWLMGEYEPSPAAKILHFTNTPPWFAGYEDVDGAHEWRAERAAMLTAARVATVPYTQSHAVKEGVPSDLGTK